MAEIYTVRSILGDEGLQKFINEGKSKEEIINIAKAYKDEALKSGDKDALSKMNLVNEKQGRADFFTRLGDDLDANGYESLAGISRGVDILASKVAAPIAGLMGDSDKEAQFIADARLTQSINEAKNLDKIATTGRTQKEYKIDSNNLLANAIGSYANDSQTYARNLIEEAEENNYTAMDRLNIGMATTANATKYLIKSFFYGEDSKQAKDIKDAQKILEASRDAYKADNPDKWNIAGFAGEMITDPLNVVGLAKGFKIANSAFKKGANVAFDLAQLGAIGGIAGAISEYGSYKDKDEQNIAGAAMIGAASGVVLGAGFMALGAGLAKIASRFGNVSTLEKNAQIAKDETLKIMEQTDTPKDTDERLKKISDDIEEAFGADENGENIARLLGQEYDDNINQAIKQSQEVSAAIDSSVSEFASANPKATANDIERYINQTYTPSDSEKELTRIINDGKPVSPRMAGYRVLGVLKKSMEYKTRFDRNTIVSKFKNHGFSDELANIFADAYIADDISVARNYLDTKVASNRDKSVDDGRNEWLESMSATKSNLKPQKSQDEILNQISSGKTQFNLIDDADMTPELKSRLESDGYTLEREPESGVWEISKARQEQDLKSSDMENSDNLFKKIRDASKKILSTFLGKTSKNNIDGREVKFTKRSLDKMTSGSAVGKSLDNGFTREEHYEVAQNILEIFKTAKFVETQPPKNGSADILGVHKYMGEYKNANVKITIKEIREHGNTFYSIELMELLSRDIQSGDPKTGNLDNTAIIHTDEEPPRPRTSSPYNANSRTIPNQDLKSAEFAELIFQDKKGKDHIITKEIQKEWMDTFGLKNLDDTYIPKFNNEIKKVLGDKKLKLQKGSLLKLVSQGRQKFIPEIKKVLDDPEIIITDKNGEFILVKHLKDKDYFVNVSFDNGEYLVSISNGIKEINNLNNKIKQGGRILYQSPNANFISQTLLQTSQYSANKIDNKTIPNQDLKSADELNQTSLNLSRAERRAMGIEEPNGKTLVIDEKAVKSDVREFGRLAHQVGLGFKSAKEAKAVMDKCDKSKFDCGS